MMTLFEGNVNAYGQFKEEGGELRDDGKVKGKGITKKDKVHPILWDEHLNGISRLGIVPINEDSKCKFGAIDIDDYDVDKELINIKIVRHKLPLVMFRSKSGGVHLYIFTRDFIQATVMQAKLKELAAFLGHGNAEIFPKQTKILKERGDVGQWINMPYFDMNKSTTFAIRSEDNQQLSLHMFMEYVTEKFVEEKDLKEISTEVKEVLKGGPPCLQILCAQGFAPGTRNNGLFNLGVYAKKVDPDKWTTYLEELNQKYMSPPLSPKEVLTTISGLQKKDYNYSCKKEPICAHCNLSLCRTKKFGVGVSSGLPTMNTLTKLDTQPPIWFVDVDDQRLQLTTEELQNPRLFQNKCLGSLSIMPIIPKQVEWAFIVQQLLENATVVKVPSETTIIGRLMSHLEDFCLTRGQDEKPDVLMRGLVWNHDGFHYFRFTDFLLFLERKRFVELRPNQITSVLRDYKAEYKGVNAYKGKYINTFRVPAFSAPKVEFEEPKQVIDIPY